MTSCKYCGVWFQIGIVHICNRLEELTLRQTLALEDISYILREMYTTYCYKR